MEEKMVMVEKVEEVEKMGMKKKSVLVEIMGQRVEDENVERGNWSSDVEFILACVGYAIGLGNVWRFPFLMYRFGGGFLFAYWLLLFLVAFPIFFYELSLGQFTSTGPLGIFRNMVPGLEGLGWATLWIQLANTVYYNAIHALAIFYAFSSFGQPWSRCSETAPWYAAPCYSTQDYQGCVRGRPDRNYFAKGRCYDEHSISFSYLDRLEDCILNTSSFAHKPFCNIRLQLPFNATTPRRLFQLLNPDMTLPEQCQLGGTHAFFQEWQECAHKNAPVSAAMWEEKTEGDKTLIINLGPDKEGSFEGADARASCLRALLAHSHLGNVRLPQIASILASYCQTTWALAPTALRGPTAPCLNRIIDNMEQFSAEQYYNVCSSRIGHPTFHLNGRCLQYFVQSSGDVRDIGKKGITYNMVLSLVCAWILTGIGIWKGPKWTGKLVYVTAVFPIFMILILIIVSSTLDGHLDGVSYYLTINWCKMGNREMWVQAIAQISFSLSIGAGGLQTLASYNRFHNDLIRDAMIVALSNCFFSLVAGFGVFGIIGHMAKQVNTAVPLVIRERSSAGLAFIVMAQATSVLPGGQILAFFFYLMLILLAIDSSFANVETLLSFVYDEYPPLRSHRFIVTFTTSTLFFLLGLPFVSRVGTTLIMHLDNAFYVIAIPIVVLLCLFSTMALYGFKHYFQDLALMFPTHHHHHYHHHYPFSLSSLIFNSPVKWYFYVTLLVTGPLGVALLISFNWYDSIRTWDWSSPGSLIKLFLAILPLVLIMVGALLWVVVKRGLRGAALFRPTPQWGPALPAHRTGPYLPPPSPNPNPN